MGVPRIHAWIGLFGIGGEYGVAFPGTSDTGMVEALLRMAGDLPRHRILIAMNGEFGERALRTAEVPGLPHTPLSFPVGTRLDAGQLAGR